MHQHLCPNCYREWPFWYWSLPIYIKDVFFLDLFIREGFDDVDDEIGKRIKREIDAYSEMGKTGPGLNSITPCAACKLLRRRCAQECPFSPYFSPHEPHKFAAVHKVFGASNVYKLIMEVAESERADAANSLVYEANLRIRDPVYGSMGAISALQQQLQSLQAELNAVRAEILKYKFTNSNINDLVINSSTPATASISSVGISTVSITAAPPPLTPPPQPSINNVVTSPSTFSTCSVLYTVPSSRTTTGYSNSITSDHNVPYFN